MAAYRELQFPCVSHLLRSQHGLLWQVSYCATALVFLFVWKSIVLRWVRSLPSYVIVLDDTLSTWTRLVIPASVALVFASLSSARQGVPTMTPLRAFLATYPSPLRTVYSVCLSVHRTVGPLVTYLVTLLVCINPPLLALKLVIIIVCMLTLILHLVAGVSAPAHSKPIQSALAKVCFCCSTVHCLLC